VAGRDKVLLAGGYSMLATLGFDRPPETLASSSTTASASIFALSASDSGGSMTALAHGLLCLDETQGEWPWQRAILDRHGLRLFFPPSDNGPAAAEEMGGRDDDNYVSDEIRDHWRLLTAPDEPMLKQLTVLAATLNQPTPLCLGCMERIVTNVNLQGGDGDDDEAVERLHRYRLCITPNLHASYVPYDLYRRYWGGASLYNASRKAVQGWSPLVFYQERSSVNWHHDPPQEETTRVLALQLNADNILPLMEGRVRVMDMDRLQTTTLAATGSDTLKLVAHNVDNSTILIGGHLLWSSAIVHLNYGPRGSSSSNRKVGLVPHAHEHLLTTGEAIGLLFFAFLYARWKLGRQWFDALVEPRYEEIQYGFMIRSGMENLVWPFLLPLWLLPLMTVWRLPFITHLALTQRDESLDLGIAIVGVLAYLTVFVIAFIIDGVRVAQAFRELARWMRVAVFTRTAPWIVALWPLPEEDSNGHRKRRRLQGHAYSYPLYEHSLTVACLRDMSIDILLGIAAWLLLSPLQSRTFSMPILFVALTVLFIYVSYHLMLHGIALAWPMVLSCRQHRRVLRKLWPSLGQVLAFFALLLGTGFAAWFLVVAAMLPLLESMGSFFAASTAALVVASALFLSTIVLLTNSVADFTLQKQSSAVRRDQGEKRQGENGTVALPSAHSSVPRPASDTFIAASSAAAISFRSLGSTGGETSYFDEF
jgi:membrane protein implicated in regulation of membrane protease activity